MVNTVRVDGIVEIPPHKWYEVFDKLSRVDDLLEILIKQVDYTNRLIESILSVGNVTTVQSVQTTAVQPVPPTAEQPVLPTVGVGLVLIDSMTTPLPAKGMWSSSVDDSPMTDKIVGTVYSDAEGVLYVEQSPNGENWDVVTPFEVSPSLLKNSFGFSVEKVAQYARVRYVDTSDNGQTNFRLYVYAKRRWWLSY
jgi:hypothetical protein